MDFTANNDFRWLEKSLEKSLDKSLNIVAFISAIKENEGVPKEQAPEALRVSINELQDELQNGLSTQRKGVDYHFVARQLQAKVDTLEHLVLCPDRAEAAKYFLEDDPFYLEDVLPDEDPTMTLEAPYDALQAHSRRDIPPSSWLIRTSEAPSHHQASSATSATRGAAATAYEQLHMSSPIDLRMYSNPVFDSNSDFDGDSAQEDERYYYTLSPAWTLSSSDTLVEDSALSQHSPNPLAFPGHNESASDEASVGGWSLAGSSLDLAGSLLDAEDGWSSQVECACGRWLSGCDCATWLVDSTPRESEAADTPGDLAALSDAEAIESGLLFMS
eukprot:CAMPEP_0118961224 /NCGR_PEP_ID=MMETSP1169-20130426/64033_1 /TAXON_ID=36882 /ORGANISM="Pyramimonas obovata, Strain CCMP722" /LENGTH=330 /DNA_ID=CAMNT_0006909377 /DNA_START=116 /DNA_END=1104 /DNA_ORIENTATION=+